jgi:hypothetical protein
MWFYLRFGEWQGFSATNSGANSVTFCVRDESSKAEEDFSLVCQSFGTMP